MYDRATGRRPSRGDPPADTMASILHQPAPALSQSGRDRPAELDRLILRCLEKDPARRPQSARQVFHALEGLGRNAVSGSLGDVETSAYAATPQPAAGPVVVPS